MQALQCINQLMIWSCDPAQVLQRPGPLNLRDFSLAVHKLHATATFGTSDAVKTGKGRIEWVTHMAWVLKHPDNLMCMQLSLHSLAADAGVLSTVGLALKSLVTHLAGRSGLPAPLETTVCLLGHVFNHEAFRRAITEAGRAGIRLQFVALLPSVDAGMLQLHACRAACRRVSITIKRLSQDGHLHAAAALAC